jgi:hypothetical protein
MPSVSVAQTARELQIHGTGVFAGTPFVGGGVGVALRSAGRARAGFTLSAGVVDGVVAGRSEILLSYHVAPYRRRGVSPYGGGGIAIVATADSVAEFVVLTLGVESTPGRHMGWFAELGVAGGVRLMGGVRIRWRARRS